jgi:hypothetical protein
MTDHALKLPPRIIPLLYLGTAHVSLALACFLVGWSPRAAAGFFYHSWMVAIVHLVTLGWITLSILGALYIVGPAAPGMPMPSRRADYFAYAFAVVGIIGMVGHFWIQEYGGMAWSALAVTIAIVCVAARVLAGLRRATAPTPLRLHIALACVNVLLAASAGILLGVDKVYHVLPGFVLSNVFAHAHLAALGWATMMVVGVGYRLMPMILPAQAPSGRSLYASAILLEVGVLILFVGLIVGSRWAEVGGLLIVAALGCASAHVAVMVRHPRSRPAGASGIDFGVLHAAAASASLLVACVLGVYLLFAPPSDLGLRVAPAYGVFGLVGFLAQMVVAMEARLLPVFAWYRGLAASGFHRPVTPPYAMRNRSRQRIVFLAWLFGVPTLAVGLFLDRVPMVAVGAWALFAGVSLSAVDNARIVWHVVPMRRRTASDAMGWATHG